MKASNFFFILIAISIISCGQDKNNITVDEYDYSQDLYDNNGQNMNGAYENQGNQNSVNTQRVSNGKKLIALKDGQGRTAGHYPVPKNWKRGSGDIFVESNDGVKVTTDLSNEYVYSHLPDYNQMMRQNGAQVKPVKSLDRFIKEDLISLTKPKGMKLVNVQRTPSITQANAQKDQAWFKSMPEQMFYESAIVDFTDAQGNPSFILVNYYVGSSQYQKRWGVTLTGVESPRSIYGQTKKDFIFAVVNSRLDPQYVQAANQKNQQASQQSFAASQGRMKQLRDFGANNTRNFNARSAAFDAQHNAWQDGQNASYASHKKFMDGINEVDTWSDGSGNTHEVDGYHNKMYTNGNGEYIATDDWNYNPNIDNNVNGNWEELDANDDNGWNY